MKDGLERPIIFVSRLLPPTEKTFVQIDKEAATLIFGVEKFHQYLHGRTFKLCTNHKPQLGYFKGNKRIPKISSARI